MALRMERGSCRPADGPRGPHVTIGAEKSGMLVASADSARVSRVSAACDTPRSFRLVDANSTSSLSILFVRTRCATRSSVELIEPELKMFSAKN